MRDQDPPEIPFETLSVLEDVARERERQNEKWKRIPGHWPSHNGVKLAVLVEEVGEVASALYAGHGPDRLREELIQVAAVAVAWAETLPKGA